MTRKTLDERLPAGKGMKALVIAGALLLNVFSVDAIERIDNEWVINVPDGETLTPTAEEYAEWSGLEVHKRGEGRLVIADAAAEAVDLVYEDGSLAFTRSLPRNVVAASESASGWYHYANQTNVSEWTLEPFVGGGKVSIGYERGFCSSVTSRKEPIVVNGLMKLSGRVKLCKEGSGSWGFALVLHNDPRGYSARADGKNNTNLGYAGDNAIRSSFAIGFINYHGDGYDHSYCVGRNGTSWVRSTTDPAIDFNTYDGESQIDRVFDMTLESDSRAKTVTLTLVQDQNGTDVTFTRTFEDTDLTEICGNDTAYLAFTTDAGGRSTVVTIENLKVEYNFYPDDASRPFLNSLKVEAADPQIEFDLPKGGLTNKLAHTVSVTASDARIKLDNLGADEQTISLGAMTTTGDVGLSGLSSKDVTMDDDEANARWYYACYSPDGTKLDDHTPYAGEAGVYIGSPGGSRSALTVRKSPISIAGRMKVSGKVKFLKEGSGSWGFALVLHNDPRGYSAQADCKENTNLGYAGDNAIRNSFAIGFINLHNEDFDHAYYVGINGTSWVRSKTNPAIDFNTYDGESQIDRVFDMTLESDSRAKTVKLTLIQDQNGTDVTFTRTFEDTDLTEICGNDTAYLAFTTDAGGRSTVVTIENLKVEYVQECRPVVLTQGAITMPDKSNLALDAVDMMFDLRWKFSRPASVALTRDAKIVVVENVSTWIRRVTVGGSMLETGIWNAANCDWVVGAGSVTLGSGGTMMIFQ